jgi:uncharacterized protein with HEPN domain
VSHLRKYVSDLHQRIGYIEDFVRGGREVFMQDVKTQEAVIRSYEVIGEIVKRIPQEILDRYPDVVWKKVKAFRDFLIHNYDEIDLDFVWDAVEALPDLRAAVEAMQRDLDEESDDEG